MTKKIYLLVLFLFVTGLIGTLNAQPQNPPVKGIGIVVKKKPSNGASRVLAATNDKGVTEFTLTEKGSYIFSLTQPSVGQAKTQGGPVQGVKVAMGKNPPGAIIAVAVSNGKGEVEFKDLEPGNYFIKINKDSKAIKMPNANQN